MKLSAAAHRILRYAIMYHCCPFADVHDMKYAADRNRTRDELRRGFAYLQSGQTEQAAECCRRVLSDDPKLPEAHFLVGLVAIEMNQRRVAVSAFGSVTRLQPDHGAAWANLARQYALGGQLALADEALANAIKYEDGKAVVHDLIGSVHTLFGEDEKALGWYEQAARNEPDNIMFRVNHANCLMFVGQLEEAEKNLREVLTMQPGNANAHWMLASLRKAVDRMHVNEMEQLVASGGYPQKAQAFLYYALGKELEDLEEWEAAFSAFERGARARRSTIDYDEASEVQTYAAFGKLFTKSWMDSAGQSHDSDAPIFIVGQPRTGTTLVERIITSHSMVHSAGELRQFGNAVRRLTNYSEPMRFSAALAELAVEVDAKQLGGAYIQTSRTFAGDTPHFVDKLPLNYLYLPLILKALPKAKIIHLRRNPMDACFSSFKQLFADAYPHSYDQEEMARHHARYYRLMETWRERFGDRFFEVAYEDVAGDIEPNARAMIEFLALPWEDACLEFHKQKSAVKTASSVQVRQPAHTRSVGRWRRYEQQLAPTRRVLEDLGIPLEL